MSEPVNPEEMQVLAEHWNQQAEKFQQLADDAARQAKDWRQRAESGAAIRERSRKVSCGHVHTRTEQRTHSDDSYSQWTEPVEVCEDCGELIR